MGVADLRSPKLNGREVQSKSWYRYYAGYSPDFVADVLNDHSPGPGELVLDPWNGSGTTTSVSHEMGRAACGFDLNPVLVLVAKGRLVGAESLQSLTPLAEDLILHAEQSTLPATFEEPLEAWFGPGTARCLRSLERSTFRLLVDSSTTAIPATFDNVGEMSNLAAYFYVVLFSTVRKLTRRFVGSNPTWVKKPTTGTARAGLPSPTIMQAFREAQLALKTKLADRRPVESAGNAPQINVGDSTGLPLADRSVDLVVTSPPYCTRIDYAVASCPELAVLGATTTQVRRLRNGMMGTPTINPEPVGLSGGWGPETESFLEQVKHHNSKASSGYYLHYFNQYYRSMWNSLVELRRVTRDNGHCVMVVQDSFYKDIHIDLAAQVTSMGKQSGWNLVDRSDFDVACTKAALNPGARNYRSSFKAKESVLTFA